MAFTADGSTRTRRPSSTAACRRSSATRRRASSTRSTRRSRSTRRTASPSRPTASRSTPPTAAGVVTFDRDRRPARSPGRPSRTAASGTRASRRTRWASTSAPTASSSTPSSARSTRSSSSRATSQTGALTRVPGQQGCVSERGRLVPDDPATAGACVAAPAMLGIIDITVGPDGNQLYTVSDQRDSIAVFTRDATTGKLTRPRATRSAWRPAASGTGRTTTTRCSTRRRSTARPPTRTRSTSTASRSRPTAPAPTSPAGPAWRSTRANASTGALTQVAGKDGCSTYYETEDGSCAYTPEREVRAPRVGASGRQARLRGDRRERGRDDVGSRHGDRRAHAAQSRSGLHGDAVLRGPLLPRVRPGAASGRRLVRRSAARTGGTSTPARSTTARSSRSRSCARPSAGPGRLLRAGGRPDRRGEDGHGPQRGHDPMPNCGRHPRRRGRVELRDHRRTPAPERSPPARRARSA